MCSESPSLLDGPNIKPGATIPYTHIAPFSMTRHYRKWNYVAQQVLQRGPKYVLKPHDFQGLTADVDLGSYIPRHPGRDCRILILPRHSDEIKH